MPAATLTSKGQVTIPKEVREYLRVDAGDRLEFSLEPDGSVRVRRPQRAVGDLYGMLRRRGSEPVSIAEMHQAVLDAVAAEDERSRTKDAARRGEPAPR